MSIRPALAQIGVLSLFWLMLVNEFSLGQLCLGLALAAIAWRVCRPLRPPGPRVQRLRPVLVLAAQFVRDVVTANVTVARVLLTPRMPLHPHVVRVPLVIDEPKAIVLLASIVALTPDTVVIEIDFAEPALVVHVLVARGSDSAVHAIKTRYEPRIKEIFGC